MSKPKQDFGSWVPAEHVLPDLVSLVVPIGSVSRMSKETNPQRGNVAGIAAALDEFKQHIPIVARNSDNVILKGNNTHEAAESLGWAGIAVVWVDDDDETAIARMLSDNFTSSTSHADMDVMAQVLPEVVEAMPELFELLGYDEYELAALDEVHGGSEGDAPPGYVPPVIIVPPSVDDQLAVAPVSPESADSDGTTRIEAPAGTDHHETVTTGASDAGAKTIKSYTLIFDDDDQKERWYAFMRWLRADPGIDGDTIGSRLVDFLEAHADF